jgi:hypothetical protein
MYPYYQSILAELTSDYDGEIHCHHYLGSKEEHRHLLLLHGYWYQGEVFQYLIRHVL